MREILSIIDELNNPCVAPLNADLVVITENSRFSRLQLSFNVKTEGVER